VQSLLLESYVTQKELWPKEGRHILAQYDAETIFVYQAYSPAIGKATAEKGTFTGGFSYSRMSWIKPNFLWMMYRSGWGTKENQQVTLALRIRRSFFESLLSQAVASTWNRDMYATEEDWSRAVATSDVRLQWDPDHHPSGAKLERRAIQLGLRGDVLAEFGKRQLLEVLDISEFVESQRQVFESKGIAELVTPKESVYIPSDPAIVTRLRLDSFEG